MGRKKLHLLSSFSPTRCGGPAPPPPQYLPLRKVAVSLFPEMAPMSRPSPHTIFSLGNPGVAGFFLECAF